LNQIIALNDPMGDGLVPWAMDGFECFAYHPRHRRKYHEREPSPYGDGSISFVKEEENVSRLVERHKNKTVFLMAFPPCEALSRGSARWWRKKFLDDPDYQSYAVAVVKECWHVAVGLGNIPFYIENPVGMLDKLWREPDHVFEPFQFGAYLPKDDVNPHWPRFLPPQDAYRRKICLWTGHDFKMPVEMSVSPKRKVYGKKAPRISRRVIPRGFSRAVFLANH
jgi:hypothetical protein